MREAQYHTNILVIGGGASGLSAAMGVKMTDSSLSVIIAERLPRVGKKILATGNGRCNLGNKKIFPECYHSSIKNHMEILSETMDTEAFFNSMGVVCVADNEGRMYPYSNAAASVLSALHMKIIEYGIEELCGFNVSSIEKKGDKFFVSDGNIIIEASRIIVSAGGCAAPTMGTDGNLLKLLENMGHKIIECFPAVAPLQVDPKQLKGLKGVRAKGIASAWNNGVKLASEKGEIQFNEAAISGICVFNLSYLFAEHKDNLKIIIDLAPDFEHLQLVELLISIRKIRIHCKLDEYLTGMFNKNLVIYLLKKIHKNINDLTESLNADDINKLAATIKNLEFKVVGAADWKNAQVTRGGIDGICVDRTLQSKNISGLYFTGEILDIDGLCGGYNLMWAWSSGLWAGKFAGISLGGKNDKNKQYKSPTGI